jgi:dipeptidyl aminopeptidase/acylaminoacyl peptidase
VSLEGGRAQRLTEGDYSILSYDVSRDGRRVAFHRAVSPVLTDGDTSEVWVMDMSGSNAVKLTGNGLPENGATLSPDGTQVMFVAAGNAAFEKYYNRNIFLAPAGGGAARLVDVEPEAGRAAWSRDGKAIFFIGNQGVHSQLFRLDISTGRTTALTKGDHDIRYWAFSETADRHVLLIEQPENPGDVWTMSAAGTAEPARVTRVYEYLARDFDLPKQERVTWKGADGVAVEGVLFYPLGYTPGRRYPLCVQTHGGPQASDKFGFGSWGNYVQVLTAKGYAVLQPNYRGSTGYGDAFLRDMVGHYFKNAHLDVMAGVDHLIAIGLADPDRMVKMGWSGGGHMTNKIITFTDRFKAAASGAGASNWVSMYAQSDTRSQRTPWFGGTPWQKNAPIDLYWEHSPLKYVANVKTPTIFLVGGNDERVPPPQSVEMYRALESLGVPTHLYMAPREPHGWQELRHQLFKMNVELDWFERWATKRPYSWEKAPDAASGRGAPPTADGGTARSGSR